MRGASGRPHLRPRTHSIYGGGTPYWYLSVELDASEKTVIDSIVAGETVWFTCNVKQFDKGLGVWDVNLHDYGALYGVNLEMSKAERLRLRESGGTHAMTFVDNTPARWRVENSWGEEVGRGSSR